MPTDLEQLKGLRAEAGRIKLRGRKAFEGLATAGFDLSSPDILGWAQNTMPRLKQWNAQLQAVLNWLIKDLHQYQSETNKSDDVTLPDHTVTPALGSTIGDQPGFPGVTLSPDESNLIDELNDRIFGQGPGTGIRNDTGIAFDESPGVASVKKEINDVNNQNQVLKVLADLLDELLALLKEQDRLLSRIDRTVDQINQIKKSRDLDRFVRIPNPDAVDDEFKPKFPVNDPWADRLRHPKDGNPLSDPNRGDLQSGSSNILITRGQSTDPVPGQDKDQGGSRKIIATTKDAATDPSPDPSRSAMLARIASAVSALERVQRQ